MGRIIFLLMLLFVLWLIFKILKGIISFLFGSNSNKETSSQTVEDIDSNSNKETSNHDEGTIDDKLSDLKYDNEVYISFRNKVQKAYESYKKSGYRVSWDSDNDGFLMFDNDSASVGGLIYEINVRHDDRNIFKLDDPFYIVVSYGITFDRRDYDDYEEKAEYLNNKETRSTSIFYTVDIIEDSNFGVYYTHFLASNNESLCKETKEFGEAELFRQLIIVAKEAYHEGEEIYGDEVLRGAKNFSN